MQHNATDLHTSYILLEFLKINLTLNYQYTPDAQNSTLPQVAKVLHLYAFSVMHASVKLQHLIHLMQPVLSIPHMSSSPMSRQYVQKVQLPQLF